MQKNWKKIVGDGLLFLGLLALTVYAVFHGADVGAVRRAIRSCDWRWLIPAVACVAVFIGGESVIIRLLLRSGGYRLGAWQCFLVSSAGFFFSAVTPSAGGGQPMQAYFLNREKVPVPVAAVTLLAVTITYKMVLIVTSLALILFRYDFLLDHFGDFIFLFWGGLIITASFTAFLLMLVFHPHMARKLCDGCLRLLEKLRILRRSQSRRDKLLAAMDTYHETAAYFKTHMGLMALVQLITFAQRYALFTVPWLVYRAFGLTGWGWLTIAVLQAAIQAAADMLPLPGGMGVTEAMFLAVFGPVFGSLTLPAMVLSRGTDFYCRLLISAVFTALAALLLGRRDSKGNEATT